MKNTSTFGTTTPESAKISPICTSLSPFSISLSKNTLPKPESQTTPSISSKLWSLVKTRIHVSYAKLEENSLTAKTVRVFFMSAVSANTMLVASNAVRRLSNLKMPKWTVQRATRTCGLQTSLRILSNFERIDLNDNYVYSNIILE